VLASWEMTLTEPIYQSCRPLLVIALFHYFIQPTPNSYTRLQTSPTASTIVDNHNQQQPSTTNSHHGLLSALPRSPTPASIPASLIRCQLPINTKTPSSTTTVVTTHNACRKLPSLPRSSSYQTFATSPQMRVSPPNAQSHANMTEPRLRLLLPTQATMTLLHRWIPALQLDSSWHFQSFGCCSWH
jgi:hypothetical protein